MRLLPQMAVALFASLAGVASSSADPMPRPVLVLDQSIPHTAWINRLFVALQSSLKAGSDTHLRIAAIPSAMPLVARLTVPLQLRHPNVRFTVLGRTSTVLLNKAIIFHKVIGVLKLPWYNLSRKP